MNSETPKGATGDAVERSNSSSPRQLIIVHGAELQKLDVRPSFLAYIKSLWERRFFIATDARFKAFRTTRDYRLWKFWLVAQPMLDALMYGLLFGVLLHTSNGVDNYLGFLVLGITFFNFMTKVVLSGSGLIRNSKNLMQAFPFPRASLVISLALRYLLDTLPAMAVAIVFAIFSQLHEPLHWTTLLVIPLAVLIFGFSLGVMFVVTRLTAFIPDVKAIMDILVRAWFFSSGVFYSIDRFATHPTVHAIMTANPAYVFLTSIRGAVLSGINPTLDQWGQMIGWSLGMLLVGFVYFWRAEERYVRVG